MTRSQSPRHVLTDAFFGDRVARVISWTLAVTIVVLLLGIFLGETGRLTFNSTNSVPRGFYWAAEPENATYITFCLGTRHRGIWTYPNLCSPDTPENKKLIKRISQHNADGSLVVVGDTVNALDSRFLGAVRPEEIQGWWRPALTEDMLPFFDNSKRR